MRLPEDSFKTKKKNLNIKRKKNSNYTLPFPAISYSKRENFPSKKYSTFNEVIKLYPFRYYIKERKEGKGKDGYNTQWRALYTRS